MKEIIHTERLILKCDACEHRLPNIELDPKWIGHPCPACGANMLSFADYEAAVRLGRLIDLANRLLGPWFGTETPSAKADLYTINPRARN